MTVRLLPTLAAALLLGGCAKFPDAGTGATATRLVFTLQFDREINRNYVYVVAINPSTADNPTVQGPIPVIAPPWGNGFVAGNATHFVGYNFLVPGQYNIYRFKDAALNNYEFVGVPVQSEDVLPGGNRLRFEINLAQIAQSQAEAESFRSLQVNLLSMDRVPQSGTGKVWDALGDGRLASQINSPVVVSLRTSRTYTNGSFFDIEPRADAADPDLDLVDFTIEVRRND
ncbi:MAG: hypothetical protein KIS66_08660 [Fimbriimonadaceae bacterium]|nr:hypothetical protein [Fimbriimonadaceae bacterium]